MAIANSDGSIILSTKVDTSGVKKATNELRSEAMKLAAQYRKAGMTQSEAQKRAYKELGVTTQATKKATKATKEYGEQAQKSFSGLKSTLQSLAGYLALAFSVTKIIQFSNESASLATQTEASVQRLVDIYGSAADSVGDFIDANARALGMSKAAAASFSSVYGNLFSVWADQATNAELTNRYLNMTAVIASKTGRTVEDVQERIRSGLLGNTEAIEDLGVFVNVKTIEMTDAFQRMAAGQSWEQLDAYTQQQIRSMAILEQATAKYGDEVADTSATIRNRFNAAYQDFQNTWGQLVNAVLLPALEVLTNIFDLATQGLNAFFGNNDKVVENAEELATNSGETAENIKQQTENQKELNKEMKKTLAGFDDIQKLSAEAAEQDAQSPTLNILGGDNTSTNNGGGEDTEKKISDKLQRIMRIIAVSLAAVGLILLVTGNIGFGIGFIVAGAAVFGVTEAATGDFDKDKAKQLIFDLLPLIETGLVALGLLMIAFGNVAWGIGFILAGAYLYSVTERSGEKNFDFSVIKKDLQLVAEYIDKALLAVGVVLLFLGMIPLGIGFILTGAAIYGIKEVQSKEYSAADLKTKIAAITEVVSLALATIGVVLLVTGNIPLGLGFIVAGFAMLGVSEKTLNEGAVQTKIQKFFRDNKQIIVGVTMALLVLGILLLFVPGAMPLAISLIAAGAVGLVTVSKLNKDNVVETINSFLFNNSKLIALISGGLLVIGILVCFVNLPLGIALIATGATGLVTVTSLNWDGIVGWVSGAWNAVKNFWNRYIAPVFTAKFWLDLAKKCGNGLISGFEAAINGIIGMFEKMINWIVDGLNKISINIPDWVPGIGGKKFGIDIPRASLGRVKIPRLAEGAVLPPNKPFLSIVGEQKHGTNVEAPLSTIQEALENVLDSRGGGEPIHVHLYLDGKEIYNSVVTQNRKNTRITGENALAY